MAITTLDISPEDSIKQQLETWEFEKATNFINSSRQAVERFVVHLPLKSVVIDLGCGDGAATEFFKEAGMTVIGVDVNRKKLAKNNTKTVRTDMVSYLEKAKSVPNVFIHHALEHLPNPQEVLDLIEQKLEWNGRLYVEVPEGDHLHSVHHATFDTPEDLCPKSFRIIDQGTGDGEQYVIARKV